MLSGFYAGRVSRRSGGPGLFLFLRRKFKSLLLPFFAWNAVLLILNPAGEKFSLLETLYYFLTGSWQLYYIFALFQMLLINFFIGSRMDDRRLDMLLAISALLTVLFYAAADITLWISGSRSDFFENHLNRLFPAWYFFFVFGMRLRRKITTLDWLVRNRLRMLPFIGLSYALYVIEFTREDAWLGFNPLQQFLLAGLPFKFLFSLYLLATFYLWREKRWLRRLASVSNETYGIYLSHTALLTVLFALWQSSGYSTTHWIEVPLLWVAVWAACLGANRLAHISGLRRLGVVFFGTSIAFKKPAT